MEAQGEQVGLELNALDQWYFFHPDQPKISEGLDGPRNDSSASCLAILMSCARAKMIKYLKTYIEFTF
jgi:hypothetical protein